MARGIETRKYLDIPYQYGNGPQQISDRGLGRQNGINCETLTHWVFEDNGNPLPKDMLSKEIYEDDELFKAIKPTEELEPGDVFIFGRETCNDPRKLHLAVYTGETDEQNNALLIDRK